MSAKTGMIVVVLLLSAALVGCPSPTDVTDAATAPTDNGADNTSPGTLTPADQPTGGDGSTTTGDGSSTPTDGSSTGDQPQDNGSAANDSSNTGSDPGGDDPGDSSPGGGGDAQPVFRGTYSGPLACHKAESLMGLPGPQSDWTQAFSFTFDQNGIPTAFVIPGYMQAEGGIEFIAEVGQVGESVTLNETRGTYNATLTVTVAVATYNETSANVVLSLEHYGQQGSLTQEGTGMHVVQYDLDGANLAYSSLTTYEVMLSGQYDTTWDVDCEGTLAPQ